MKPRYAFLAVAVFLMEVAIALWWRDGFVRPYLGDVLAVVLVYLALRAATDLGPAAAATIALTVAVLLELAQLFHLLDLVGLGRNGLARVVAGGVFDPRDLACYAVGAMAAFTLDERLLKGSAARGPG